jgi:hypothetical protein
LKNAKSEARETGQMTSPVYQAIIRQLLKTILPGASRQSFSERSPEYPKGFN